MTFFERTLLAATLGAAACWNSPAASAAEAAQLGFVTGVVTVNGKVGVAGQAVTVGTVIETKAGRCTILVGGETVVRVGAETRLQISEYDLKPGQLESATVDLKYGQARALVKSRSQTRKKFVIRTRSAVMGVRGTQVFVDVPKDSSLPARFLTLRGVADLSLRAAVSQPVVLRENELVRAGGGEKPSLSEIARLEPRDALELASVLDAPAAELGLPELAGLQESPVGAPSEDFADPFGEEPWPDFGEFIDPVADGGALVPTSARVSVIKQ